MRLELSGSIIHPEPLVLTFNSNQDFDTLHYIGLEYTHFEVICIGGGGGSGGGGVTMTFEANTFKFYGGAGGGGGFHRVRGLLTALPNTCPVVVGEGGAVGTNHATNPTLTTDGHWGGISKFNDTTCRASGGNGGKRVSESFSTAVSGDGGDGGTGNSLSSGGGGIGGIAGDSGGSDPSGTPGQDGSLVNNIGKGGGGGAGGVDISGGFTLISYGTSGGRGSYNPSDTSVYGPGGSPSDDPVAGLVSIFPGGGGGAKASPLNGLPFIYGQSQGKYLVGDPGVVILRLTAE